MNKIEGLPDKAETLKIKKQVEKDKLQKVRNRQRMYCKKPQRRAKGSKIRPGKRIIKLAMDYTT